MLLIAQVTFTTNFAIKRKFIYVLCFVFNEYHIIKSKYHFLNWPPYFLWQTRPDNNFYNLNMKYRNSYLKKISSESSIQTKTYTNKNCRWVVIFRL